MEFPGRKPLRAIFSGVSRVTFITCRGIDTVLPGPTDNQRGPPNKRKAADKSVAGLSTAWRRLRSADLCSELADHVSHLRGHLGVLPRMLAVERLERHRELQVLDDPRTRETQRLARLVMCPHAAVLAVRPSDDRRRLALQRPVAEGPRQPVDRVLQHTGNAAVVLRG